ncbi:hypothetical protein [Microtetraspora malaysiensis]|uniref:hypothetical protein n=1 Tax=Microtetraspora malaysiensis TaxID=161358 RepID=UPI003D8B3398
MSTQPPLIRSPPGYAERWQAELAYYQLKCTLRGKGVVLRGQAPELARQEIWALLTVYNALCDLAAQVAALEDIDPRQISFVAVLRHTRTRLAGDIRCAGCGHRSSDATHALNALLRDIIAHPRNRIGRNRTGPRTAAQRRTQRSSIASYSINAVESNLPKMA